MQWLCVPMASVQVSSGCPSQGEDSWLSLHHAENVWPPISHRKNVWLLFVPSSSGESVSHLPGQSGQGESGWTHFQCLSQCLPLLHSSAYFWPIAPELWANQWSSCGWCGAGQLGCNLAARTTASREVGHVPITVYKYDSQDKRLRTTALVTLMVKAIFKSDYEHNLMSVDLNVGPKVNIIHNVQC